MNRTSDLVMTPEGSLRFFGVIALLLFVAHSGGLVAEYAFGRDTLLGTAPLFDFDRERNVPTLFSATLFLVAAGLACLVARAHRAADRPFRAWVLLAGVACFLAVDEVAGIHEAFAAPLRESLHVRGFFRHAWVIPYGIAAAVFAGVVAPVFRRMRSESRARFLLAGGVYVTGAVGLEMVGGKYQEIAGVARDLVYETISTVEESMEMAGLILVVRALVSLLGHELGGATIAIPAAAASARETWPAVETMAPEPSGSRPPSGVPRRNVREPAQNIR